jgi:hypothetical protein
MRANKSSAGDAADQFHTTRFVLVMVSAEPPSQSASLALCDAPVAAEGGLRP